MNGKEKVLVIGLDGGSFNYINQFIEDGPMPNLKNIIQNGVHGDCLSTVPPITALAWPSITTGKNPGNHGVFGFLDFQLKDGKVKFTLVDSRNYKDTLWDIMGRHGKKSLILNVPPTYPAKEINGMMISCFLSPVGSPNAFYPKSLKDELKDKFGCEYPVNNNALFNIVLMGLLGESKSLRFDKLKTIKEFQRIVNIKFETARYLYKKDDFDLVFLHEMGTDGMSHFMWDIYEDKNHQYYGEVCKYFSELDKNIGMLIDTIGNDATVFFISDHGSRSCHKKIILNTWLLRNGYITIKNEFIPQLKYLMWKKGISGAGVLIKMWKLSEYLGISEKIGFLHVIKDFVSKGRFKNTFFLSYNDLDYDKSMAVGYGEMGGQIKLIYKNEQQKEEIKKKLIADLEKMTDENGNPLNIRAVPAEEIYSGEYYDKAPDLVFSGMDAGYPVMAGDFTANEIFQTVPYLKGTHRNLGLFIAYGDRIKKGERIEGSCIYDLAPTILYNMGLPIPTNMDGKVLGSIFTEEFLSKRGKVQYEVIESSKDLEKDQPVYTEEEEEIVKNRLRDLGYID